MKKNKVGILTWHYYYNFGSALQTYALAKTLSSFADCEIINYRNPELSNITYLSEFIHYLASVSIGKRFKRFYYPYIEFQRRYFKQTQIVRDKADFIKISEKYSTIVCGSDQIWAPSVLNDIYLLNGVDADKVNKVSYAASLGLNTIPDELKVLYDRNLSSFSKISVREEKGREVLERLFGLEVTVVLDPTLLLDKSDYDKIVKPCSLNKKFVFCYFLGDNEKYRARIEQIKKDYILVGFSTAGNECDINLRNIGPSEFLWLIKNAEMVLTDSYHGTIFSLIYHKEFYTFERFSSLDNNNQNSRIETLVSMLSIQDRVVPYLADMIIEASSLNYNEIDRKIIEKRKKCIEFLKEAVR